MMMTRRSERMARPLQMTAGMQVQSAIASRPAYGRVCAQLSCLILHALTLQHLSQPAARRPFAPTAAPLSLLPRSRPQASAAMRIRWAPRNLRARASQGRTIAASPATLFRDPVRSPPRGCHARLVARWLDQLCPGAPFAQDTADSQRALPLGRSESLPPPSPQLEPSRIEADIHHLPATYRCSIVNNIV